jgi:UDP-glucose 4-epimerase
VTSRGAVVVVGGAGFVGRNLVASLLNDEIPDVVVIDNLLSSDRSNATDDPRVRFIEGSIADDAVLDRLPHPIDTVFHLATYHGNQSSMFNPIADHSNNLLTTIKLFDRLSRTSSARRVVYASAGCTVAAKTYGSATPTTEDDPVSLHLDSPYQISKIAGEMYANYFHDHLRLPVIVARFQNVYGPGEVLGAGRWRGTPETVWRNVTPTFIYRALKGLPLRLDNEGMATRDFIYVEDVVRGLRICGDLGTPGDVYNLASGRETTIRNLAETIAAAVGVEIEIDLQPRRDWDHSGRRVGSTAKTRDQLGFVSRTALADGIASTVTWTRTNLTLIDEAIYRHRERLFEIGSAAGSGLPR